MTLTKNTIRIFGVQTSSVNQLHSIRDDSKVEEVIENTDTRVETTVINLQDDLVLTDKKGSVLSWKHVTLHVIRPRNPS